MVSPGSSSGVDHSVLPGVPVAARLAADHPGSPRSATVRSSSKCASTPHSTSACRLARAVRDGVPATSGVLLQFPLYGGIFGMIAYTGLHQTIADRLVSVSNEFLYPAFIAIHSRVLGVFVPSGGGKWVVEAPYVLDAANQLHVDQGWMVVVHDLGEAGANLLQPFWMLPTPAILGLKARDVMGYTFAMFLALFPPPWSS
ncbi:TIGR00366 family protein [Streptomyces sp. NBC_00343]|uniref:TIGR00366 family protein n=1 Tax=Streptomyces sp. NBC_00343 TaxID=2975719 RepID=UPI002E2C8850|nr:TIGR00366 family protein [Streptomyces sp. NBC_00343]